MEGNDIIIWFSAVVSVCVVVWAVVAIRAYDKIDKEQ
jgi:hypothetical protein